MGDSSVDAIMIATSSDTHVDLVIEAVRTGKPVLCEKPLASNLEAARSCIATIGRGRGAAGLPRLQPRFDRGHAGLRRRAPARSAGWSSSTITSRDPLPPPLEYVPRSGGSFET